MGSAPSDADDDPSAWTALSFLGGVDFARSVCDRLALPKGEGAFEFCKTQLIPMLEELAQSDPQKLMACLIEPMREEVAKLQLQEAATAVELSDKFASANELTLASPETFEAGIEGFLGPPLMYVESEKLLAISTRLRGRRIEEKTMLGQMGAEHTDSPDSEVEYPSQKGKEIVKPKSQWWFLFEEAGAGYHLGTRCAKSGSEPIYGVCVVFEGKAIVLSKSAYDDLVKQVTNGTMSEEKLLKEVGITSAELGQGVMREPPTGAKDPHDDNTYSIPGRRRKKVDEYWVEVLVINEQLVKLNFSPVVIEEMVGAVMYTGPMYLKYNAVLRFYSKVKFLQDQCVKYKLGKIPASGLQWQELNKGEFEKDKKGNIKENADGSKQLAAGMFVKIENAPLAAALCKKASFTQEEFDEFQVQTPWSFLSTDCVVVAEDGKHFKPSAPLTPDAEDRGFTWTLSPTRYATTIHTINSIVIKLSKLTVATPVFRGVAGMRLPKKFFEKDRFGIAGGCDFGFMSTTTDRKTAEKYANVASADVISTIIMIIMGMVDRGADIGFLSQFPGECEILFGPLTALEVQLSRVSGSAIVVQAKLSVNLKARTLEQVTGQRKKMMQDMTAGLEMEVRQGLRAEGKATAEGTEAIIGWLRTAITEEQLVHDAEWFNVDQQLLQAMGAMLELRRAYDVGGKRRTVQLTNMAAEEVTQYFPDGVPALKAARTCAEAKELGYTPQEVKAAGYSCKEAKESGYSCQEAREAGYPCKEAREAGYSFKEAREAGHTLQEMKEAGYSCKEAREARYSCKEVREVGYSCKDARVAGYSCKEAREAGYSCKEARAAGYSCKEAREAGYSCKEAREAGYSCKEAREAGYSCKEAREAGYSCKEAREAGYSEALQDMKAAGYVEGLKAAGYSCKEARAAGYHPAQAFEAGFTHEEGRAAGYYERSYCWGSWHYDWTEERADRSDSD